MSRPFKGTRPMMATAEATTEAGIMSEVGTAADATNIFDEAERVTIDEYNPAETYISLDDDDYRESVKMDDYYDTSGFWFVPTISVWFGHPDLTTEYEMGDPVDDHPPIHYLFEEYLEDIYHPNIDDLIRNGFVLPRGHPDIRHVIEQRSLTNSPASILSYIVAAVILLIVLIRNAWKLKPRTEKIPSLNKTNALEQTFYGESEHDSDSSENDEPLPILDQAAVVFLTLLNALNLDTEEISPFDKASDVDETSNTQGESEHSSDSSSNNNEVMTEHFEGPLPSLDHRRHHALTLNQNHHDDNLGPQEEVRENILVYKEKKTTMIRSKWNNALGRRFIKSDVAIVEAMNCLFYVIINIVALCTSSYSYPMGFGSLSAGNTLFLVMTAARNSVFTWLVGMSFDQTLIYHRFIGRLTVLTALIHSVLHYEYILDKTSEKVTVTGLVSMSCGLLIFATSLNCVRRKLFNVFYWSHSAFLGFFVGIYLHAAAARPFIWASVACYALDKLLAVVWTQCPRRTTKFEKVGDRTAHVQFRKTPLMNLLGRYKVGQYVFVNFPELSIYEWHPFSVASAPSEDCIDLYIRALGNHTRKIVDYSESCVAGNKQALIRCDGPYGDMTFNYRRYGQLLLVGGGIGITPLISVLKDIYGNHDDSNRNKPRHCLRNVTLVWIMPKLSEASLFLEMLNQYRLKSIEDPLLPTLHLAIYLTRDEKCDDTQIVHGRPNFEDVVIKCVNDMSELSRSMLVYACGPGSMVNNMWDVCMKKPIKKDDKRIRVDFYYEDFEF